MGAVAIAADVIMGAILGLFLFVVVKDAWPGAANVGVAAAVFVASIFLVLVRNTMGRERFSETSRRR